MRAVLTHWMGLGILSNCCASRHKNNSLEIVLRQSAHLHMEDKAIMQMLTKQYPRNCLLTAMDRYLAVVRNMEQVVMIPSLLRDVQLSVHGCQAQAGAPDLYSYFTMLKAIRVDVEHGLLPREEWQVKVAGGKADQAESEAAETEEVEEERVSGQLDLEAQFHLHFSSLHHILIHLTLKAEEVTRKYQEIMGKAI
ncbi:thyroid hormone-inducible hepatic protein [Hippopotamus amphibius kiboko]|uniref:thyroid hormone-inducible hepatic protein n=1 Tax=Hippopotamus amphibius kiboko TaxID=575201 RepID=UPI002596B09D|nr:thyroid hormone-inducible hepatic protein [Hippopotamus amphibius kiboko]XP_057605110.1 thyroid hormone-inducible hepatic protein [Hippopotamus amphibius kiboko]XP_057605112.1 thyroid hormone-inducible hepatic protein [Hippopotamus amphibius kiboko]